MEFGLLGPIELSVRAAPWDVPSAVQRALIAVLALAGGRLVSNTEVIAAVWDEQPSARRMRNLHFHVSKLRGLLRELEPTRTGSRIVTLPSGYRLELAEASLDSREFGRHASHARALARSGELADASIIYGQALSLWRGPALADVTIRSRWLTAQATRLDEQRLTVIEDQAASGLAAGRHDEILADLAYTSSQAAPRPRLTSLLMIALYRSGRQAEALAAYVSYRRAVHQQFDLEPDDDLQHLHDQILTSAPGLVGPAAWPPTHGRHERDHRPSRTGRSPHR